MTRQGRETLAQRANTRAVPSPDVAVHYGPGTAKTIANTLSLFLLASQLAGCEAPPTSEPNKPTGNLGFGMETVQNSLASYRGFTLSPHSTKITAPSLSGAGDYAFTVTVTVDSEGNLLPMRFAEYMDKQNAPRVVPLWPMLFKGTVNGQQNREGIQFYAMKDGAIGESNNGNIPVTLSRDNMIRPLYSMFFKQGQTYAAFQTAYHELVASGKGNDQNAMKQLVQQYIDSIAIADPNASDEAGANKTATVFSYSKGDISDMLVALLSGAGTVQAAPADEPVIVSSGTATPGTLPPTSVPASPTPEATATTQPLETQQITIDAVTQYANAMTYAGIPTSVSDILKQGFAMREITGVDGKKYEVASTQDGYRLMIKMEGGGWKKLTSRVVMELGVKSGDMFKYFGAQFSNPFDLNTTPQVDEVVGSEFNAAFLNDAYWHVVEQQEGYPDFSKAIDAADKARARGMFIIGGQLVDPRGEFEYTYLKDKKGLSSELLLKIMKKHIIDEMTALKGKVDAYVVVNESRPASQMLDGVLTDPFNAMIGEDYIRAAFQTARDTDPQAILLYNDNGNHQLSGTNYGYNTQGTLEIIKRLNPEGQARGLIDGVGIQLHIDASQPPDIDNMIKTLGEYGIPVYITEFEVNTDAVNGSPEQKAQVQAELYRKIFTALLKIDSVVMVSHWTALNDGNSPGRLFDDNLNPTINTFIERQVLFDHFFGK